MFDLEKSIADWQKQMLATGIQAPAPLQELEIHLREEIEEQMKAGLNARDAFDFAVKKIGHARALKLEFKKVVLPVGARFVKLAGISCGFVAGVFSLWMLYNLLVIHEADLTERMAGFIAVAVAILSWRYGARFLPCISRRWVRTTLGLMSCLVSIGGMALFIKSLPHFLEVPAGAELPVGRLLIAFTWAWAAATVLAAIAYRLEDAAHKRNELYV